RRHPPVLPNIAVLNVAGDVAEDEVLSLARPGRAFRPVRTGPQPADWSTSQPDAVECRIDDDDVRVRIDRWPARGPVARRAGDRARRRAELSIGRGLRLGLRYRTARCQRGRHSGCPGGQNAAARQGVAQTALVHAGSLPIVSELRGVWTAAAPPATGSGLSLWHRPGPVQRQR